ncbi:MAG: hypothetical protein IJX01_04575 [Oscillospiraceae bacterium]|nr:hypothetical protein [Oscillospiraceae bacterium]
MLKLYFKKFFLTILFFVGFLLIGAAAAFLWVLVLRNLFSEQIRFYACIILAGIIILKLVYDTRRDSNPYKREFLNSTDAISIPFWKDFWATLRSKENLIHTLAFTTLNFFFSLPIGIRASSSLWTLIIGMIILLVHQGLMFTAGNTLLWCVVHRRWLRYRQYANYNADMQK